MTGRSSLADLRTLELGSGFGELAGYLAWHESLREVVAVDNRPDYTDAGRRSSEALGVGDALRFVNADMRELTGLPDDRYDLALLNNSLIYLPTRRDTGHGRVGTAEQVLRRGGTQALPDRRSQVTDHPLLTNSTPRPAR